MATNAWIKTVLTTLLVFGWHTSAQALTKVWTNGSASIITNEKLDGDPLNPAISNWMSGGLPATTPVAGDIAQFDITPYTQTLPWFPRPIGIPTLLESVGYTFQPDQILFADATPYTLRFSTPGTAFVFGGGGSSSGPGVSNASTALQTINVTDGAVLSFSTSGGAGPASANVLPGGPLTYVTYNVINGSQILFPVAGSTMSNATFNVVNPAFPANPSISLALNSFGDAGNVNLISNGWLDVSGSNNAINSLNADSTSQVNIDSGFNLTLNGNNDMNITGVVTGGGGFTKNGTGTLTLQNSSNNTGLFSLNDGTLLTNSASIAGNIINMNATSPSLIFDQTGIVNGTFPNQIGDMLIGGAMTVTVRGGEHLTLGGVNSYNGSTFIEDDGTQLQVSIPDGLPIANLVHINDIDAQLQFVQTAGVATFSGTITGPGPVLVTGNDTSGLTLTGTTPNDYTGGTTVTSSGTTVGGFVLTGAAGTNLQGDINAGAHTQIHFSQTIAGSNYTGNISGAGEVAVTGPINLVTFTGTNTHSGATFVGFGGVTGTLNAGAPNTLSPTSDVTIGFGAAGDTLNLQNNDNAIASLSSGASPGHVNLGSGRLTLLYDGTTPSTTFSGQITGPNGGITVEKGTLILNGGASNYTGTTYVPSGTLQAAAAGSLAPASLVVLGDSQTNKGSLTIANGSNTIGGLADSITTPGAVKLSAASSQLIIANTGSTTYFGAISGTAGSNVTVNGGGLTLLSPSGANTNFTTTVENAGSLTGNTNSLQGGNIAVNDTSVLIFDQDFNGTYAGVISGTATNANSVQINGGGQVTIPGPISLNTPGSSSITVPVTVNNGSLLGDTDSLGSNITLAEYNSEVIFAQNNNGNFAHTITGTRPSGSQNTTGKVTINSPTEFVALALNLPSTVNVGLVDVVNGNLATTSDFMNANINAAAGTTVSFNPNSTTYSQNISGGGLLNIFGNMAFASSCVNTYTGGTVLAQVSPTAAAATGSTLALQGDFFLDATAKLIFDNSLLPVGAEPFQSIYKGDITGPGKVVLHGGQEIIFAGQNNSYTGTTAIHDASTILTGTTQSLQGEITIDDIGALLNFDQTFDGAFTGILAGIGGVQVSGPGVVYLQGPSAYTGGTTVLQGTLQGNTTSLQGNIANSGTVSFEQDVPSTFSGTISGTGNIVKQGTAQLQFTTPQTAQNTYVNKGELKLNTLLTSDVIVQAGGILTGTGTIARSLTVNDGGTIAPGNSIGAMTVGSFTINPGAQYPVQINGSGASTLINSTGTAVLNGGDVDVTSPDGTFLVDYKYRIVHSDTSLEGSFSEVNVHGIYNPDTLVAVASYDPFNAFITLQTDFLHCALTEDQTTLSNIFDNIINPTPEEEAVIQQLAMLSCSDLRYAFDQMSGQQYRGELFVADMSNRQFIRRLYDPLRCIITQQCPCQCGCDDEGLFGWFEGGTTRVNVQNSHRGTGLKSNGYELAGGLQKTFDNNMTFGGALGYYQNNIHYRLPGSSKMSTITGGIYGLYRPECFYALGDLIFGCTNDKMHRKVCFGNIHTESHSHPHIYQGTFYGEVGTDYWLSCILVQPFAGIELGYAYRPSFSEHDGNPLDLSLHKKNFFKAFSRLGVHLSSSDMPYNMVFNVDLSWIYRLSSSAATVEASFADFGPQFETKGFTGERSGFEGIINVQAPVDDIFAVYAEATGEIWQHASTFSIIGGLQARW